MFSSGEVRNNHKHRYISGVLKSLCYNFTNAKTLGVKNKQSPHLHIPIMRHLRCVLLQKSLKYLTLHSLPSRFIMLPWFDCQTPVYASDFLRGCLRFPGSLATHGLLVHLQSHPCAEK